MANSAQLAQSSYLSSLEEAVRTCEAMRKDKENPQDISFAQYVRTRWGVSMESFYDDLGINPAVDTIQNIVNMPDPAVRWILPEYFTSTLTTGLRSTPIHSNLIATSQSVKVLEVTQPMVNMSDAMPLYTGIAESIRLGDVSFDQKTVKVRKLARGISIPYELRDFVSLNVLSIFIRDYGVQMGIGKDNWALEVLLNGDQANGSQSAAVLGVATANTLAYRDMSSIFLRMSRLGRRPTLMVGGENIALDALDLDQFSKPVQGSPQSKLSIKTPIPNSVDLYVHSGVPDNQIIMVDPSVSMIEYVAQPLLVESEKIVSNQTESVFVSFMSGFGILQRDGRVVLDKSVARSASNWPTWLDPSTQEKAAFKK